MNPTADDTRQRLINTAGEIFAEHGFRAATVREICSRAQANVASINYYFGDKEGLYIEAVQAAHCGTAEMLLPANPEVLTPVDRLRYFIREWLRHFLDEARPAWQAKLMLREMAEPTAACEKLVEAYIRPMAEVLRAIIRELLPESRPEEDHWLVGFSIVGQCLFYKVHRPVVVLLYGKERFDELTLERLTEHICQFSLAALGLGPTFASSEKNPGGTA